MGGSEAEGMGARSQGGSLGGAKARQSRVRAWRGVRVGRGMRACSHRVVRRLCVPPATHPGSPLARWWPPPPPLAPPRPPPPGMLQHHHHTYTPIALKQTTNPTAQHVYKAAKLTAHKPKPPPSPPPPPHHQNTKPCAHDAPLRIWWPLSPWRAPTPPGPAPPPPRPSQSRRARGQKACCTRTRAHGPLGGGGRGVWVVVVVVGGGRPRRRQMVRGRGQRRWWPGRSPCRCVRLGEGVGRLGRGRAGVPGACIHRVVGPQLHALHIAPQAQPAARPRLPHAWAVEAPARPRLPTCPSSPQAQALDAHACTCKARPPQRSGHRAGHAHMRTRTSACMHTRVHASAGGPCCPPLLQQAPLLPDLEALSGCSL